MEEKLSTFHRNAFQFWCFFFASCMKWRHIARSLRTSAYIREIFSWKSQKFIKIRENLRKSRQFFSIFTNRHNFHEFLENPIIQGNRENSLKLVKFAKIHENRETFHGFSLFSRISRKSWKFKKIERTHEIFSRFSKFQKIDENSQNFVKMFL